MLVNASLVAPKALLQPQKQRCTTERAHPPLLEQSDNIAQSFASNMTVDNEHSRGRTTLEGHLKVKALGGDFESACPSISTRSISTTLSIRIRLVLDLKALYYVPATRPVDMIVSDQICIYDPRDSCWDQA